MVALGSECEVCGKPVSEPKKVKIEKAVFQACEECAKLGQAIDEKPKVSEPEEELEALPDLPIIVRKERERRSLSQKELAERVGERLSVIKRIESGFTPPNRTLSKLERFFNRKLRGRPEEGKVEESRESTKTKPLTLGDVAEVKGK